MHRLAIALGLLMLSTAAKAEWQFDVHNNSDQRIVAIEASEDGRNWRPFDIGRGIASEDVMTLVWAADTDDSGCEWLFRATFAEGYVSDASEIDFCDGDLEIYFDFD